MPSALASCQGTYAVEGTDHHDKLVANAVMDNCPTLLASRLRAGGLAMRPRLIVAGTVSDEGWVDMFGLGTWPVEVECQTVNLIQWAARCGYYKVLEVLLQNGGDADATSEQEPRPGDLAPFLYAAMLGTAHSNRCLQVLAAHHANVNVVDPWCGNSALHLASNLHDSTTTMRMLVELGVGLEIINNNLMTALYVALEYGDVEAIRFLGSVGADMKKVRPILRPNHGMDPRYDSRVEIVTLFVQAVATGCIECMKELVLLGADVEVSNATWVQSEEYNEQKSIGELVNSDFLPWLEAELNQAEAFVTFLMSTRRYSGLMGHAGRGLVAEYAGLRSGVERGRLRRACDAIKSGRFHTRSPWPWCEGSYYIQYRF